MQEDKGALPVESEEAVSTDNAADAAALAALTAGNDMPVAEETYEQKRDRLPPAARRALAEAEARRSAAGQAAREKEIGGRGGLDPARFGDWEIKGRAIDF